ncbi:hypothetical protein BV22DRAFT_986734, partial [Leucogyrophana mollusca]
KKPTGQSRLLKILISKSTYLIWVLRCKRTIGGLSPSLSNITKRWANNINQRINNDRILASLQVRKKLTKNLVKNTWLGTLQNKQNLPKNCVMAKEVLLGIR